MHPTSTFRQVLVLAALHCAAYGASVSPHVAPSGTASDNQNLTFLREVARSVLDGAKVAPGGRIPGGPTNATGFALRLPGATLSYYPAFWVRDAAMMLGADFVPADEVEGWIRLIAATQPGADGLSFPGGLRVPSFSIPDHITLAGEACWYPGAYTEQGQGDFGFLPPADDAFFFIQMVREHARLTGRTTLFESRIKTGWGEVLLSEASVRAFESVAVDPHNGLVICEAGEGRSRVDWGFCDTVRKTGLCLMPSLLRWRAARELGELFAQNSDRASARRFRVEANRIRASLPKTFYRELPRRHGQRHGLLLSATGLGRKDDVWASAFAVWLGVLPRDLERAVARHLLTLYERGGTVVEGQVRHLPRDGEFGGWWETVRAEKDTYQNGGYWGTPTGWLYGALRKVDRAAASRLLGEYVSHLRAHRTEGAPWEWISPAKNLRVNPLYGSSAGLVYVAATTDARGTKPKRQDLARQD